jgi:serine/threonine protein kinase
MEPPLKKRRRHNNRPELKVQLPPIADVFGTPVHDKYGDECHGVKMGRTTVYKSVWSVDDAACEKHVERLKAVASLGPGVPRILYIQRRGTNIVYMQSKMHDAHPPAKWSMSRHAAECLCDKIESILMQAHSRGLFHRDINPSNILVSKHRVYVVDWDHQDNAPGNLAWVQDAGADSEALEDLQSMSADSAAFDLGALAALRDYWLPAQNVPSYIG